MFWLDHSCRYTNYLNKTFKNLYLRGSSFIWADSRLFGFLMFGILKKETNGEEKTYLSSPMKREVELNGVNGLWIENIRHQKITITTDDKDQKKMQMVKRKRWLEQNPEPHFTIALHEKIKRLIADKSLTYCGRIFAAVIHTNFEQDGLIYGNGKALNIEGFGSIFKLKSRQAITDALKELEEGGLIRKEGRKYYLNKEYHFMGALMEQDAIFSKLYHRSNRTLLENVSPEAMGLLYKIIPLVNYINGSICLNPEEKNNELVEVLIREDLADYLKVTPKLVTMRMNELIENGAILPIQIKNSVYYKVHPDFVSKIDYFASHAIKMMIEEHQAVQMQLARRRRDKKKKENDAE